MSQELFSPKPNRVQRTTNNFKTENKENVVRFEVIRRPTNDETNKDKDNKQTKIVRGSHNTYITSSIESVVVP